MNNEQKQPLTAERLNFIEQWRDVDGYEGLYLVSNTGKIYSKIKDRFIKQATDKLGYKYVELVKNKASSMKKVHRLVAFAFLRVLDEKCSVNHIDKNTGNNNFNNLQIVSTIENNLHSLGILSCSPMPSENKYSSMKIIMERRGHKVEFNNPHDALLYSKLTKKQFDNSLLRGHSCNGWLIKEKTDGL